MNHMPVSYSLHIYRSRARGGGDFGRLSAECECVVLFQLKIGRVHSMITEYLLNEIEDETNRTLFSSSVSYSIEVPADAALVPSTKKRN